MELKIKSGAEMNEEYLAFRGRMGKEIVVRGRIIEFTARSYDIHLDEIRDEKHLLKWVRHLVNKTWMTKELMAEFIDRVARENGFDIHGV